MSDRVSAELRISGALAFAVVVAALEAAREAGGMADNVAGLPRDPTEPRLIHFDDCKYGGMDDGLKGDLQDLGVSYAWVVYPGLDEMGPHIEAWRSDTDEECFYLSDGQCSGGRPRILLSVGEAQQPSVLAKARQWQEWIDAARLEIEPAVEARYPVRHTTKPSKTNRNPDLAVLRHP